MTEWERKELGHLLVAWASLQVYSVFPLNSWSGKIQIITHFNFKSAQCIWELLLLKYFNQLWGFFAFLFGTVQQRVLEAAFCLGQLARLKHQQHFQGATKKKKDRTGRNKHFKNGQHTCSLTTQGLISAFFYHVPRHWYVSKNSGIALISMHVNRLQESTCKFVQHISNMKILTI